MTCLERKKAGKGIRKMQFCPAESPTNQYSIGERMVCTNVTPFVKGLLPPS